MPKKKPIFCLKCSYRGPAFILTSTKYEKLAIVTLLLLCWPFPALLFYTIPLLCVDFFVSTLQMCPSCHHYEVITQDDESTEAHPAPTTHQL